MDKNARLAAKLTGWKIDIKSESEAEKKAGILSQAASADTFDNGEYEIE
ncbi:hypothetical protein GCM10020331_048400 [Ectobacillus funiculus]